ncbi:hypothetical protein IBZ12_01710 [Serratia ureilytica]|uniref:hypothetical protein n=1 Tax=Serratia ureilytica TaxID=300181 RepID=UPI0039B4073D
MKIMPYRLKKSIPHNFNDKEDMGLSNYHFRRGTVSDALCIVALFQAGYGISSHPCNNDEEYVRIAITNEDDYWFVAEDEFCSVIGCLCISYNLIHRSWVIGKAMIFPLRRQLGVILRLMQFSIDSTPISMSDLVFIELRSDTSYPTLQKYVDVVIVGYNGGLNTVEKKCEHHAIAIAKVSSDKYFRHCFPNKPVLGSDCASEKDVFSALCKYLACFDTDIRVTSIILADKLKLITDMIGIGFRITSCLPAWYLWHGKRYDCLMLVKGGSDYVNDNGLGNYVKTFDDAYRDIEGEIIKKRWG